ncbi:hypothetical protein A3D88_03360 [Candidatus Peribacteria bacterium RIFCSPHIGHO2_02_FULL_52_16]|nr:MAG: hypothetical protein A2706_04180 [Candidatus Peribacteria bacterium RIFCSPHIGHO2_01_FULL_51_35]OGJ61367.1 MAG: hypothetical protein A3D88_03360 [Candidatus Peribacteria bacterium RIFCSPHIGHO2_02_FULL_52_16]
MLKLQDHSEANNRQESDAELVEHYRQNDEEAFAMLVSRYESKTLQYIRFQIGDRMLAEDIMQKSWVKVITKVDTFNNSLVFRSWFYTIVNNQIRDAMRRRRVKKAALFTDGERKRSSVGFPEEFSVESFFEGREEDPSLSLERSELKKIVRKRISRLSEDERTLVRYIYFDGLKYREAAERMDIPIGTVRSRLYALHAKLREVLLPYAA